MRSRTLGTRGPVVSALGLGCMGMSFGYGPSDSAQAEQTLRRAVELGVTLFDTAEMYGPYLNEELLRRVLRPVRDQIFLATKFGFRIGDQGQGMARINGVDSQPVHIKHAVEGSLRRLGVEVIDLLYQHRVDPAVPVEDVVGTMGRLVQDGKVRFLGLCEVSAATLRRAHAVHPITAVQSEYSLWMRDVEAELLPACRELDIGFVPYSPLGRGALTGGLKAVSSLAADDYRRSLPRFQADTIDANLRLVAALTDLAAARGTTAAQLALAWLLAQGDGIVPIPGARKVRHLEENLAAAELVLTANDLALIEAAMPADAVVGARYGEAELTMVGL